MNILHRNLISAWYLNKCSLNMNLLLRLNTCSTFVGSAHISHLKGKGHSLWKSDFMPKYISKIVLSSSDLFLKGIVYVKDKKYKHLYIYTEHAVRILWLRKGIGTDQLRVWLCFYKFWRYSASKNILIDAKDRVVLGATRPLHIQLFVSPHVRQIYLFFLCIALFFSKVSLSRTKNMYVFPV